MGGKGTRRRDQRGGSDYRNMGVQSQINAMTRINAQQLANAVYDKFAKIWF